MYSLRIGAKYFCKSDETSVRQEESGSSQPFTSAMCGCRLTNEFRANDSKKAVVRGKGSDWRLLKAADASSHCVCPGILTGYRPALDYLDCLRSILRIHNETVNIWYVSKLKTTKTIEIITL